MITLTNINDINTFGDKHNRFLADIQLSECEQICMWSYLRVVFLSLSNECEY